MVNSITDDTSLGPFLPPSCVTRRGSVNNLPKHTTHYTLHSTYVRQYLLIQISIILFLFCLVLSFKNRFFMSFSIEIVILYMHSFLSFFFHFRHSFFLFLLLFYVFFIILSDEYI